MKMNPKKFVAYVLVILTLMGTVPIVSNANAQTPASLAQERFLNGEGVLGGFSAVSTSPQILLRYTGTFATGGTVTVSAGGDITFSQGPVGSSAVDATMECDASIAASGSRSGIYDLSTPDVACDTLGEVVDKINSQGSNWLAVIVHGLRSDATDNVFITLSETAANSVDGVGLLADGTTLFKQRRALIPFAATKMGFYVAGSCATVRTCRTLKENPFAALTTLFYSLTSASTYGSGTSAQQVNCVAVRNSILSTGGGETVTTISRAAGATTVESTWSPNSSFGVACPIGQKMVAEVANSAAMSASYIYVAGHVF
jgi:hypothetical protein